MLTAVANQAGIALRRAQQIRHLRKRRPIISVMDCIIVMPLVSSIDSTPARDITRSLLAGIRERRGRVVILDVTGVPIVDMG